MARDIWINQRNDRLMNHSNHNLDNDNQFCPNCEGTGYVGSWAKPMPCDFCHEVGRINIKMLYGFRIMEHYKIADELSCDLYHYEPNDSMYRHIKREISEHNSAAKALANEANALGFVPEDFVPVESQ